MKSKYLLLLSFLTFLLAITFAQGIQGYISSAITFIITVLVPFLLGLAFLFFAFNAIRFFVLEGSSEDGREKAKALTVYSVIAIVLILSFWGIINVVAKGTGLSGQGTPTPDYLQKNGVQFQSSNQNNLVNCILPGGGGVQVTASECADYGGNVGGPNRNCIDKNGNPGPC